MHFLRIVAVALFASVLYGILLDQVTARICVEYFTIGQARLIDLESPASFSSPWPEMPPGRLRLLPPELTNSISAGCASLSSIL